jgi:TIR domain
MARHFVSYSAVDAGDFAVRIVDELAAGRPALELWLDKRELKPGLDWDEQIGEAIKKCDSLLFVMSRDSVTPSSVCKREWTLALKYKKPVIPLRLHADAELPFRLEPRQYIDFSGEYAPALARLRRHLVWLTLPEGRLQTLRERLTDATRELPRAPEHDRPRLVEEIAELERQIERQQRSVEDPNATVPFVQVTSSGDLDRTAQQPRRRHEDRVSGRTRPGEKAPASQPRVWEPEVLERARQDLAAYIGPMARVIVGRVAVSAPSLEKLYEILAAEIESPSDREKFLAARPR